ncbi:MAG: carbohydrate-binding family 9-like protein [Opitutaceae bacterium]|nr:carbohydrate-binding family 9-like protein [Opitutaceae bacterium]
MTTLVRLLVLGVATVLPPLPAAEKSAAAPDPATLPAPGRVVVPRRAGPVTIDGELNEAVWAGAARLTPFHRNDGAGPEREPTVLRIWYDDTALYLAWTCTDADVQATLTARDANLWDEEVVEFFVAPRELRRYYELQWNPVGGIFDAIVSNDLDARGLSRQISVDRTFTAAGMRSALRPARGAGAPDAADRTWQVEIRIPFSDLGESAPRPGDVWRGNFYRYNRTRGQKEELVSWSPTRLRSFHQPSRFGFLEFGP